MILAQTSSQVHSCSPLKRPPSVLQHMVLPAQVIILKSQHFLSTVCFPNKKVRSQPDHSIHCCLLIPQDPVPHMVVGAEYLFNE